MLVHGGAVDPRAWGPVSRRLGEGWRTATPLRPSVDDVAGLLEPGTVLVGASMGGGLALAAAARHPALVERLVLVAPLVPCAPVTLDTARLQRLADAAAAGPAGFATALLDDPWFAAGLTDPAARDALRRMVEDNAPGRPDRGPWAPPELSVAALAQLTVPTVVVIGELDDPANTAMSTWTARHLPGARLEIAAGVGHVVELVRPDVVVAAMHTAPGEPVPPR